MIIIISLIIIMIRIIYIYIYILCIQVYKRSLEFITCLFVFLYAGHDAIVIYCSVFVLYIAFMYIHFFIHLTILLQFYICQILLCCMCMPYLYFSFLICIHLFIKVNCVKYIDIGLCFLYTIRYLVKHDWLKVKHV